MLSTIQISGEDSRQFYHNALLMKISDLKRFTASVETNTAKQVHEQQAIDALIDSAISFRNLFNIKNTVITLTINDVDLLTRILDTQA